MISFLVFRSGGPIPERLNRIYGIKYDQLVREKPSVD
jgi:hypothetical protein